MGGQKKALPAPLRRFRSTPNCGPALALRATFGCVPSEDVRSTTKKRLPSRTADMTVSLSKSHCHHTLRRSLLGNCGDDLMTRQWMWRGVVLILLAALLAITASRQARTQGANDLDALNKEVVALYGQGKYAEAMPIAEQYADAVKARFGGDHPQNAVALDLLAQLLWTNNRLAEAEPVYRRALAIDENIFGSENPKVAFRLIRLAQVLMATIRLSEAEPLMRRALSIDEKSLGPEHPDNSLARLLRAGNRFTEAEPLMRRALSIDEKSLGPEHPDVARNLNSLAELLRRSNRHTEAEPLMRRALGIEERSFGPEHPDVAIDLDNLAQLLKTNKRLAEAEPLMRRVLAIHEKILGPEHYDVARDLDNLAQLLRESNRLKEAEPLMRRALAIKEKNLGPEHAIVGIGLSQLAQVLHATNQHGEAESFYRRALTISEKSIGAETPTVAFQLHNLAMLLEERGDWAGAIAVYERAKPVMVGRHYESSSDRAGLAREVVIRNTYNLLTFARAVYRAGAAAAAARERGFELAQWAQQSSAADALSKMAPRISKGSDPLANLVRERQDLIAQRQHELRRRHEALSHTLATDFREWKHEYALATEIDKSIGAIDKKLDTIDARLSSEFTEYAELDNPKPLTIAETQALLKPGEALLVFLVIPQFGKVPEETLAWVVTKEETRWRSISFGTRPLSNHVTALRCGLDYDGTWGAPGSRCADLLKTSYTEADHEDGKPLPFDRNHAHALYKALFGQIEDVIKDKHLLIVPSGALTQLPFQVLVTEKPGTTASGGDAFRRVAWLIRKHALTVLPSVSSLRALRQLAKDSHADRSMIGFGNPLLDGPNDRFRKWASAARAKQSCPKTPEQRVATFRVEQRGVVPPDLRSGLADVTQIRVQVPLPETADELCEVARDLGVSGDDIHLGARATETEIKRLSETGELAKYRMIHFATHGALAGQVNGNLSEPGLLLTPSLSR
jgi:tetratricopeptide (TPR) repeat protein